MEAYNLEVNDRSLKLDGGEQCIKTPDGYVHLLSIDNGLVYSAIRPYTDQEWKDLPKVVWTSPEEWDSCVLDNSPYTDPELWFGPILALAMNPPTPAPPPALQA